jgi:VIT1/CCC1 family predicted Fe2+/Mn2+ transporter
MLRQGPIPLFLHGVLEYLAGVLLIAAPFILGFDAGAATAASIVAGVFLIFVAAVTDGPTGLIDQLPLTAHVLLDYILAGLLIALPFLFGFSDESAPTAFFIALGVVHLLVSVATRYLREDEPRRRSRRARA